MFPFLVAQINNVAEEEFLWQCVNSTPDLLESRLPLWERRDIKTYNEMS